MEESDGAISPLAAILAVIATFVPSLFLGAAILILFGYSFALIFGELFLVIIPLGHMLYKKVDVVNYIGLKVELKPILLGIAFGLFLLLFNLIVSTILVSTFGVSEAVEESNRLLLDMSSSPEGLLSVILALSLAGLCEEFTFRGFLQTAVNSKYSSGVALFVSSIVFGFFHFDPQGVYTISAFLMGLVLGYIYYHWHSYIISAVAHSTLNLIILALMLLVG
jgi:membrane protease YdiL (CAAX protease family)